MILSIWRYCHFSLAAVASLFLILVSLTGAILAFEPITNSLKNYSINNLDKVSLKQAVSVLDKKFKEVYEIQITNENFVSAKVLTFSNKTEEVYLNPINGETLENVKPKSKFLVFSQIFIGPSFLKNWKNFRRNYLIHTIPYYSYWTNSIDSKTGRHFEYFSKNKRK